jgi:hypothetical protein
MRCLPEPRSQADIACNLDTTLERFSADAMHIPFCMSLTHFDADLQLGRTDKQQAYDAEGDQG